MNKRELPPLYSDGNTANSARTRNGLPKIPSLLLWPVQPACNPINPPLVELKLQHDNAIAALHLRLLETSEARALVRATGARYLKALYVSTESLQGGSV